ncbi:MAG TPA: DNA primase, partial [Ferruginibacter sp.]|nr:DNA primase [Ferruginibacter sp.]
REELYKEEVTSTLTYLKLKKIKRLIAENQREFELKQNLSAENQLIYLQTHQHLKEVEMQLTKALGTVILK